MTLTFFTPAAQAASHELSGVPEVISGDEIQLDGERLRLVSIDAPDLAQRCLLRTRLYNCGEIARAALLDLTAGTTVRCKTVTLSPKGVRRAHCTAAGYDLSEGMVYTGWALAEPDAAPLYGRKQAEAERKKHGLWRGRFVAPWDWTRGRRLPEEQEAD